MSRPSDGTSAGKIELRVATLADADAVLTWQSDPVTRRHFRNPAIPTAQEHAEWFEQAIDDPMRDLFVITRDDERVGMLRLDRRGDSYEVSILVAPTAHRQGIGLRALQLARAVRPAATLLADVHADNVGSRRLFESAGYRLDGGIYKYTNSSGGPAVAILCDGGPGVGLGHFRRCLGLAQALEQLGAFVFFIDQPGIGIREFASSHGFAVATNPRSEVLDSAIGADALVIDHYRAPVEQLCLAARRNAVKTIVFDDSCDRPIAADMIVNGALSATGADYARYGAGQVLAGAKYQVIRSDLASTRAIDRSSTPRRLFVSIGGGDPLGIAPLLGGLLGERVLPRWPDLEVDFVSGPYAPPPEGIWTGNARLRIHRDPPNAAGLLARADIALVAAGQTMFEVMRCGIPALALGLADNQLRNLAAAADAQCVLAGPNPYDPNWLDGVEGLLTELMTSASRRTKLSQAAAGAIDGRGAHRIAEAIVAICAADVAKHASTESLS